VQISDVFEMEVRTLLRRWPENGYFEYGSFIAAAQARGLPESVYMDAFAGFIWGIGGRGVSVKVRQAIAARETPYAARTQFGTTDWLFRDEVYTTKHQLQPDEVRALALEAENKVKARISRAKALMEQVEAIEGPPRELIPDDVKIFVWQRDKGQCVRCGSNRNLEFDHIIPVAMGGANTARNLQLLCEPCNRAKGKSLV
jgi:hypothetical protein